MAKDDKDPSEYQGLIDEGETEEEEYLPPRAEKDKMGSSDHLSWESL